MDNYYYIIVIAIFVILAYYSMPSDTITEKFETVAGGTDDTNAINTLAQMAQQLMTSTGAVTVPGSLNIQGSAAIGTTFKVTGATTLAGLTAGSTTVSTLAATGNTALTTLGVSGATTTSSLTVTGNSVVSGTSNITGVTTMKDVIINGTLQNLNPLVRKYQVAGYLQWRAFGVSYPLHYGFNMFWADHGIKEGIRKKYGWSESIFHHYYGANLNQGGDGNQDWTPRGLVVFPSYKITIYVWDPCLTSLSKQPFPTGEYAFNDNDFSGKRPHAAYVSYAEEGNPPSQIQW